MNRPREKIRYQNFKKKSSNKSQQQNTRKKNDTLRQWHNTNSTFLERKNPSDIEENMTSSTYQATTAWQTRYRPSICSYVLFTCTVNGAFVLLTMWLTCRLKSHTRHTPFANGKLRGMRNEQQQQQKQITKSNRKYLKSDLIARKMPSSLEMSERFDFCSNVVI